MKVIYKSVVEDILARCAAAEIANRTVAYIELDPREWAEVMDHESFRFRYKLGDIVTFNGVELRRQQWPFPPAKPALEYCVKCGRSGNTFCRCPK